MNADTQAKLNFVLFAGHTGHTFFPFQAGSWEEADAVAEAKGWVVDDHMVDGGDVNVVSVIPKSMIAHKLAPVVPIR